GLLNELKLTLTASAAAISGTSSAVVQGYSLTIPPATGGAIRVADPHATFLLGLLALFGGLLLAVGGAVWAAKRIDRLAHLTPDSIPQRVRVPLLAGAAALLGVGAANVLLFGLGSAPFDITDQETWSYLA